MSPGDRAEQVAHLRRAVARIENTHGPRAARAERLSLTRALDRRLGGGLPSDGLCEIAPAAPADATAAFGFALALAARFMAGRGAGLLAIEDFALLQGGVPFGPGLVAHGLDLSRLVFVRAPDAPALFQTMEDALKSGALAVVIGEVWRLAKYDLSVSRRLTLAARAGPTPALLVRADGAWARAFHRRRDALRDRRKPQRPRGAGGGAAAARPAGLRRKAGQGAAERRRRSRVRTNLPSDLAKRGATV